MRHCVYILLLLFVVSCSTTPTNVQRSNKQPDIYPDYIGVTIPVGIAPLNFDFVGGDYDRLDVVVVGSKGGTLHSHGKQIDLSLAAWHALTAQNKGGELVFTLSVKSNGTWVEYAPFSMFVSNDSLNAWGLTYRRIAPGYEVYGHMGLFQRELSTYHERAIIENTDVPGACFNCHTSCGTDPAHYTFHIRGEYGGTYLHPSAEGDDDVLQAVNDSIGGALVYPYWHPSGRYCAYSTNTTRQGFHAVRGERIEVFDAASDVLLYDPATRTILRDARLATADHYETYPVFSPDGTTLYFCSSAAEPIPQRYQEIRYNLCRISFDADRGCFTGAVDTIFNAQERGKSAVHPRPSYDGRYLMFTLANYGCFPIWHKEADNWILDLSTLEVSPLTTANSDKESDSWHNYSRDSRWFVFTSRRDDGLYTRLYLCHIDSTGKADKPFLLPQRSPKAYYDNMLYSYNTPDFTLSPIRLNRRKAAKVLLSKERKKTHVRELHTTNTP